MKMGQIKNRKIIGLLIIPKYAVIRKNNVVNSNPVEKEVIND